MKSRLFISSQASFSPCGLYRWSLNRRISRKTNTLIFIGLNPSKACSKFDDPTIRRLLSFSKRWNYGTLIVLNLFAKISFSPSLLGKSLDPIGSRNDEELSKWIYQWSNNPLYELWLGWGNKGILNNRNLEVISFLEINEIVRRSQYPDASGPLTLGLTNKGHPRHPLYISNRESLRPLDLRCKDYI